jgi:hypothetical protein
MRAAGSRPTEPLCDHTLVHTARRLGSSKTCSCCRSIDLDLDLDRSLGRVRWVRDEMRAHAVEIPSTSGDSLPAGADASRLLGETRVSCSATSQSKAQALWWSILSLGTVGVRGHAVPA